MAASLTTAVTASGEMINVPLEAWLVISERATSPEAQSAAAGRPILRQTNLQ